jgi:hypothetical protein
MIITFFRSVSKAYVEDMRDVVDIKWDDLAEQLLVKEDISTKEQGMLYNLALFKPIGDQTAELGRKKIFKNNEWSGEYKYFSNTVRRCKANLVALSGIVLDYDKGVDILEAMDRCKGLEYVLYTTFNHTIDDHRFRVVVPFIKPLLAEDIPKKLESMKETFPGVDNASFSVSQGFYFHAGHNDPIAFHNKGYMIDPYTDFTDSIVKPYVPKSLGTSLYEFAPEHKKNIINSLESCKGLRYPQALTLVAICKSMQLGYNDFSDICEKIADNDSTLKKDPSCRKQLWDSEYEKITGDKRDKFIKDHGGRPMSKRIDKIAGYKQDLEEIKMLEQILKEKKNAARKHGNG